MMGKLVPIFVLVVTGLSLINIAFYQWILSLQHHSAINPTSATTKIVEIPHDLDTSQRTAIYFHLIQNGIEESPMIEKEEVEDVDKKISEAPVWLVDLAGARKKWQEDWCQGLIDMLQTTLITHNINNIKKNMILKKAFKFILVENQDQPELPECPTLGQLVGFDNVLVSYRSAVQRRRWDQQKRWVQVGELLYLGSEKDKEQQHFAYQHQPIPVRTDTVMTVESLLQQEGLKLCDTIEERKREIDVAYFWHFLNYKEENNDGNLRDAVYEDLVEFQERTSRASEMAYKVHLGVSGERAHKGRKQVSDAYIETMLDSKIVVVAQRDAWEDHYRHFEAMVTGAMVMTDVMLSMPKGLEDGISIVQYNSTDQLIEQLNYYLRHPQERLKVAKEGRRIAMSRHRSWHHIEELVFGEPVTVCKSGLKNSRCPYIVHANQTWDEC